MLEWYAPDVGCAVIASSLGDKIDVLSIFAPYRTDVIGRMISQLREIRAVGFTDKDKKGREDEWSFLPLAFILYID